MKVGICLRKILSKFQSRRTKIRHAKGLYMDMVGRKKHDIQVGGRVNAHLTDCLHLSFAYIRLALLQLNHSAIIPQVFSCLQFLNFQNPLRIRIDIVKFRDRLVACIG